MPGTLGEKTARKIFSRQPFNTIKIYSSRFLLASVNAVAANVNKPIYELTIDPPHPPLQPELQPLSSGISIEIPHASQAPFVSESTWPATSFFSPQVHSFQWLLSSFFHSSLYVWPKAATSSYATNTSLHTLQCLPSVNPVSSHVGAFAASTVSTATWTTLKYVVIALESAKVILLPSSSIYA